MIFPWQMQYWNTLLQMHHERRVPHALLLLGPRGSGKLILAQAFAQRMLCQNSAEIKGDSISCGHCHACHLMQAKSHLDFCLVQPEQEGHAIKIDQIRQLSEFIQNTPHQGGHRVVIVEPATAMTAYAANALLKTLEEPTPDTLLILISNLQRALPITITSRCQQIHIHNPPRELTLAWLQQQSSTAEIDWPALLEATQGAPLLALEWQRDGIWLLYQNFIQDLCALSKKEIDPLQLALRWKEVDLLWIFDVFFSLGIKAATCIARLNAISARFNDCILHVLCYAIKLN